MMRTKPMYKREEGVTHQKSYAFALRIVRMVKYLREEKREHILSKQVLRSGTAIGALIREAEFAQSEADFINKLKVALKEANETDYWLNLLKDTEYLDKEAYDSIETDCHELIALLVATLNTIKQKQEKESK